MQASADIARAEMSVCPSVCPFVCYTLVLYQNEQGQHRDLFTDGEREDSSFCKYPVHPEIRKGPPRARAIYETRMGWVRTGDFRPLSRRISETVQDSTNDAIDH